MKRFRPLLISLGVTGLLALYGGWLSFWMTFTCYNFGAYGETMYFAGVLAPPFLTVGILVTWLQWPDK